MAGVGLLFGPMLVGVLLNMILYGAVITQMYAYYQRFADDPTWIRYFMLYLFIVGFGNVVVECGIIFEPLVIRYGTVAAVTMSPKLLHGDSIIISIVATPIQLFAAWRISVLSRSYIFPGLITSISLLSFGSGINMSVKVFRNPEYREFDTFKTAATVWLSSSAVCDVVIAVGMTHALYKRKTGFGFVNGQINRIIRLSLETGALTAITALMDIFLFLGFPRTSMNFAVNFPLSSLYICTVLVMLNSRDRKKTTDVEEGHTMPTEIRFQSHSSNQTRITDPSVDVELRSMPRVTEPFAKPPGCHEWLPLPPPPPPVAKKSKFEGSVEIFDGMTEDFGQEIWRAVGKSGIMAAIKTDGKPASQM